MELSSERPAGSFSLFVAQPARSTNAIAVFVPPRSIASTLLIASKTHHPHSRAFETLLQFNRLTGAHGFYWLVVDQIGSAVRARWQTYAHLGIHRLLVMVEDEQQSIAARFECACFDVPA